MSCYLRSLSHVVTDIEQLHGRMNRVLRGYSYAKAAIDVAMHDAIGTVYGVPGFQLPAGKVRDGVALAHSIGLMDADTAAREAAEVIEGISTIKVKIGGIDHSSAEHSRGTLASPPSRQEPSHKPPTSRSSAC